MKNLTILLIFLPLCLCLSLRSSAAKSDRDMACYKTFAALTIFIDELENRTDNKNGYTAVSKTIEQALQETASILVVSTHLLNNIEYFKNENREKWSARKLSDNIAVLVPNDLATKYRARSEMPKDVDNDHVLGIYFSDKPTLIEQDLSNQAIGHKSLSAEAERELIKLFIPRTDYWQQWHGKVSPKSWTFLFFGHGIPPFLAEGGSTRHPIEFKGRVAGFVTSHMRDLLFTLSGRYLTRKEEIQQGLHVAKSEDITGIINIATIAINSCFTGSLNMLATFSKSQEKLIEPYDFPFPIILTTPLATEVTSLKNCNFKKFFTTLLETCANPDFHAAIQHIFFIGEENIPVIKKPGIPFFLPVDPEKSANISKIMGLSRTDPLVIPDYFKGRDIKAVLIGAPIIPFTVILKLMDPIPRFFSSESGASAHEFTGEFRAPDYLFSQIVGAFTSAKQYQWKGFKFKKIIALDSDRKKKDFTDVRIINYLTRYEENGLTYQQSHIIVSYTVDGRNNFFEQTIKTDKDIQTLGEEASKNPKELDKEAEKNIDKFFDAIKKMAESPAIKPESLPPDIDKISEFFRTRTKKITSEPESQEPTALTNLAQALQILTQYNL